MADSGDGEHGTPPFSDFSGEDVADVEDLIKDDAANVDLYHVNHHGSATSSSRDFLEAISPTVAVASNGSRHGHPQKNVIERILALDPRPSVFVTNLNPDSDAWQADHDAIADLDLDGYDGIIEISVWKRTYRVWRWRGGRRIEDPGVRFRIKEREG